MNNRVRSVQIVLPCSNLSETLEFFINQLGFRLEMISPADSPKIAVISGYGTVLRLEQSDEIRSSPLTINLLCDLSELSAETPLKIQSPDGVCLRFTDANQALEISEGRQEFVLTTLESENSWSEGRARMQYRDLIPSRLGGRFIASHIRLTKGGEVADYVHYHRIRFQMIYCLSGWARLVYEDQGQPFVMNAGDCVLQPPSIRHRVLESSAGFEVLEIGCPAVHETFADHRMQLPNETLAPDRIFDRQRFVHHVAQQAIWANSPIEGFEYCDTGISEATDGLADVRRLRATSGSNFSIRHEGEFLFYFILKGTLRLRPSGADQIYHLKGGDSFVLPAGKEYFIETDAGLEMLRVSLPAEYPGL